MKTDNDVKDKVVVITGASAGLGRALAREFGKNGARVALLARGEDGLNAAVDEITAMGTQARSYPVDVAHADAVEAAAEAIEKDFGPIDIWVNNAMVSVFGPFKEMEMKDFHRVTEVTYLGQVYGTKAALKRMLPRNHGHIILVGSALAYRGIPLQSAYCGAKHGIHGFFESLRAELIHDQSEVQLNMVQLPAMNTTQFGFVKSYLPGKPKPMGKIYQPEVAARAIVELAASGRREAYVGSPTVKTIIGNKVFPAMLDRYLAKTGYKGQQTSEPATPERKDNLYKPLPGDHGAHGDFDEQATDTSQQVWLASHKMLSSAALILLGVGAGFLLKRVST